MKGWLTIKLLLGLIIFTIFSLFAQKEANNWYFGGQLAPGGFPLAPGAGMTFSTTPPTALTDGAQITFEGVATISDTAGNLLFYTDGRIVYNAMHDTMPNGDSLQGSFSSTQSGVAMKYPGRDSLYFVFTVDAQAGLTQPGFPASGGHGGLSYSIVDMRLDGGLGDVVDSTKNTSLITPTTEKLTSVRHCNGIDFWLITHGWEDDSFYVFLITENGIEDTLYQKIGMVHEDHDSASGGEGVGTIGYLKASPDGSKLALAIYDSIHNSVEMFDFDNQTGNISNNKLLDAGNWSYGVSFSADNSKLYVTRYGIPNGLFLTPIDELIQYDVTSDDINTIIATKTIVNVPNTNFGSTPVAALQNGPNGKIYVNHASTFLGAINNPSLLGTWCDYEKDAVNLLGKPSGVGLPNFVESFFIPDPDFIQTAENMPSKSSIMTTQECLGDTIYFLGLDNTNDSVTYRWNFGDPGSGMSNADTVEITKHLYSDTGNFTITFIVEGPCVSDTVVKDIYIQPALEFSIGNDTTICDYDSIQLSSSFSGDKYLWSNGDTNAIITVQDSGEYILQITYQSCMASDSMNLNLQSINLFIGNDTAICVYDSMVIEANHTFSSYNWSTGDTTPSIYTQFGNYTLSVKDSLNCFADDSIFISSINHNFDIGLDTFICNIDSITLDAGSIGDSYLWSDGSMARQIIASDSGNYIVTVSLMGCDFYDSIRISLIDCELIVTPNTIFTPNNDGLNDVFLPIFEGNGSLDYFKIFDRWGNLVFESNDRNVGWNGEQSGIPKDIGVYLYELEATSQNGEKINKHGNLILAR